MKRLVIYAALAAAAVVPATTGLLSNASFSQTVPVRTPAQAQLLTDGSRTATPTTSQTSPAASPTRHTEPGDDHGGDRDRTATRTSEPGDDHGGDSRHGSDDSRRTSDDSRHRSDDSGHGSHSGKDSGGHGSDD
jgi:hypothetical protein